MYKFFTSSQIRAIDAATIEREKINSLALMERAAKKCFQELQVILDKEKAVSIVCGTGNNGGDGLAVARMLKVAGYSVGVVVVKLGDGSSHDFMQNLTKLNGVEGVPVVTVSEVQKLHLHPQTIDALFGSGLNRPLEGLAKWIVEEINNLATTVISVDIPSGIPVYPEFIPETAVKASITLTFQFPKLTFLLSEYSSWLGVWKVMDIGLFSQEIDRQETQIHMQLPEDMLNRLAPRQAFSHKGSYGHVYLMAGSKGMAGAAILSAMAGLRTGCGLLTVRTPQWCSTSIMSAVPEAMIDEDGTENHLSEIPQTDKYSCIAIGPGLGQHLDTKTLVHHVLQNTINPVVLDADGLNAFGLAELEHFISQRTGDLILTPHPGEFDRIFGQHISSWQRILTAMEFCKKHGTILILKGRYTAIISGTGEVCFNSSGGPSLAKGGSGDTLTGVIASLIAQGVSPLEASKIGVYIHGLAGDLCLAELNERSVVARDVIEKIPAALTTMMK